MSLIVFTTNLNRCLCLGKKVFFNKNIQGTTDGVKAQELGTPSSSEHTVTITVLIY